MKCISTKLERLSEYLVRLEVLEVINTKMVVLWDFAPTEQSGTNKPSFPRSLMLPSSR
jgi:hypothetical protein